MCACVHATVYYCVREQLSVTVFLPRIIREDGYTEKECKQSVCVRARASYTADSICFQSLESVPTLERAGIRAGLAVLPPTPRL